MALGQLERCNRDSITTIIRSKNESKERRQSDSVSLCIWFCVCGNTFHSMPFRKKTTATKTNMIFKRTLMT